MRKLEKGKAANPDAATAYKSAFDIFREEAKLRKKAVNGDKRRIADFSSWLALQKNEDDKMIEEFTRKRHDI